MPNFLIIGAAKSGTTALYHYLNQHPEVFVSPEKEPCFFALEGETTNSQRPADGRGINRWRNTNLDAYRSLFAGVSGEKAVGEASTLYHLTLHGLSPIKHALKPVLPEKPRPRVYSRVIGEALQSRNLSKPPRMEPEVKEDLAATYREDVLKLQDLMQRDLSEWLR